MKFVQIVKINKHRIDKIWDLTEKHLLLLTEHSNEKVRQIGVESATSIILNQQENEEIFGIFPKLYNSKYKDVRINTLNALCTVIQRIGQLISNAWNLILPILKEASDGDDETITIAFKSVKIIGNDYLENMPIGKFLKTN